MFFIKLSLLGVVSDYAVKGGKLFVDLEIAPLKGCSYKLSLTGGFGRDILVVDFTYLSVFLTTPKSLCSSIHFL